MKNNNKQFFPSVELRAYKSEEESRMLVEGYAIVFNSESRDLGGFTEVVKENALDKALERNTDVLALYGHDYQNVLGRQSADTLQLEKDERGIKFTLDLPNTQLGRDVYTLVERGDLKGNSFGFTVEKDSWDKKGDKVIRTIEQVRDLFEISIVSLPAYEATELVKRNFEEFAEDITEAIPEDIADGIFPQTILKHL
jgi:HK97 family phage prohead protease